MILDVNSGYTKITTFSMTNTALSSFDISWGDGTVDTVPPYSHIYQTNGNYTVTMRGCVNDTPVLSSETVCVSNLIENKVVVTQPSVSGYVGCSNTFSVSFSSLNDPTVLHFYASGSDSSPYNDERTFWSHLVPEWSFTNENDIVISSASLTGTPITANDEVIGFSGNYTFNYYDDMPGSPILFVTMEVLNANSRVYAAVSQEIVPLTGTNLCITEDGLNDINLIQWAGVPIPFVISVCNELSGCNTILHYTSGEILSANLTSKCVFLNNEIELPSFNLLDEGCFSTGGYLISSITIPVSAIPALSSVIVEDDCNRIGDYEIETVRKHAMEANIAVSATVFDGVSSYVLTGVSNNFNIYPFEDFNAFRRHGESRNLADDVKYYSFTERIQSYTKLWEYVDAILGSSLDALGPRTYYSIDKFVKNHFDIDRCNIESLKDIAIKLDVNFDDYNLDIPYELKRIVELASIPHEKCLGRRCSCNTNFIDCENCCNVNVCTKCGFDKRSNVGETLTLTDYVTAGVPILYKEIGSEIYEILYITSQDNENVFTLDTLSAEIITDKGIENFCFYEWDQSYQHNPIESEIDYDSEFTILSPTVSTIDEWYGDGGVLEEMINFVLTQGLELD